MKRIDNNADKIEFEREYDCIPLLLLYDLDWLKALSKYLIRICDNDKRTLIDLMDLASDGDYLAVITCTHNDLLLIQ